MSTSRTRLSLDDALNAAIQLHQAGRLQDAENVYRQVLAVQPRHPEALHLMGLCAHQKGDHATAAKLIRTALEIQPAHPAAHNSLGAVQLALGQAGAALEALQRAVELSPAYAEAWTNRGIALGELRRSDEALASYDEALRLGYDNPLLHFNRARLLQLLGRLEEALGAYGRTLAQVPGYREAWHNLGVLQEKLGRLAEAQTSYERAVQLEPEAPYTRGHLLFARLRRCDWKGLEALGSAILRAVDAGRAAAEPFPLLAIDSTPRQQLQCARAYAADKFPAGMALPPIPAPAAVPQRLKLAYLSADFHDHATAHLIAEVFERHDRSRFELIALSFGPRRDDPWRRRLVAAFDRFEEVGDLTDREIALRARELGVHVAIDLKGYTQDCRTGIFACRAAPIQVNYLGYPGTLGVPWMDYLIADPVVVPVQDREHYAEKIAALPDCYQPNDSTKPIAGAVPSRAELGLPEEGFVFCCFNNNYKITPDVFALWMRLLARVPGSVLWLLAAPPEAMEALRREAVRLGIAAERLVFAERVPLAEHLARHARADLFLDTFHYNAHTTASDALWAGLPVLTRLGHSFSGRVAASLLTAADLPELIAADAAEYESLAVALAGDPARLAGLRQRLAAQRGRCALFDCGRYTGKLEAAFEAMWRRHMAGEAPAHLDIV